MMTSCFLALIMLTVGIILFSVFFFFLFFVAAKQLSRSVVHSPKSNSDRNHGEIVEDCGKPRQLGPASLLFP